MKICQNSLIALSLFLAATPTLADTLEKAVSGVTAAQDTLLDTLGSTKKFKPSDFSRALGNNSARNAWASTINQNVKKTLELSKKYNLPMVSQAADVATSGLEAVTRAYYGDYTGTGTVVLHTAVSKVTVTGAAIAGGKVFAYVGAVAGAWVPVVGPVAGGVVGGVVGSVGGAVLASMAIGSDAAKEWFDKTMEGFFVRDKAYYGALAKQNREDYLLDQAQQAAIVKGEQDKARAARDYGYDIPAGSSDNSEIQFSAGKLPDFALPQPAASDPGKSIPFFASNFTVQITSWATDFPAFVFNEKYIIKEGEVSAYFNGPMDLTAAYQNARREGAFKGQIKDNVITGQWKDSIYSEFSLPTCTGKIISKMQSTVELTLNFDGSVSGQVLGGSSQSTLSGCPGIPPTQNEAISPYTLQGRWKVLD